PPPDLPSFPTRRSSDLTHPVLARLYREDKTHEANTYLKFLLIDRYFPVPRARWNVAPGTVEELFTLPNYRALDDYAAEAQRLIKDRKSTRLNSSHVKIS